MERRLLEIERKQVFETGDEKHFIRAKDIRWLINKVNSLRQEILSRNKKIFQQEEIITKQQEQGRLFLIIFEDDDPIELFVEDDINRPNCPEAEEVMTAWVLDNVGYKSFKAYELGAFEKYKA